MLASPIRDHFEHKVCSKSSRCKPIRPACLACPCAPDIDAPASSLWSLFLAHRRTEKTSSHVSILRFVPMAHPITLQTPSYALGRGRDEKLAYRTFFPAYLPRVMMATRPTLRTIAHCQNPQYTSATAHNSHFILLVDSSLSCRGAGCCVVGLEIF